jgi:hypothetical protein
MNRTDFPSAIEDIIEENVTLASQVDFWKLVSAILAIAALASTFTVFWMKACQ